MYRPRSRYGHIANGASANLREGAPETPVLRSRERKGFGAIEVAHLRLLPGEVETLPFKGHLVNVHLGAPHRLVQRRNQRTHEGLMATGAFGVMPAGSEGYWRIEAASEHMSMLLEDQFICEWPLRRAPTSIRSDRAFLQRPKLAGRAHRAVIAVGD